MPDKKSTNSDITMVTPEISASLDNDVLVLRIALERPGAPSKSGKTNVLASSHGNATIPGTDGLVLGLNVYKKRDL
jgi:hypothetical protein